MQTSCWPACCIRARLDLELQGPGQARAVRSTIESYSSRIESRRRDGVCLRLNIETFTLGPGIVSFWHQLLIMSAPDWKSVDSACKIDHLSA